VKLTKLIFLLILLSSCAGGTWNHQSGDNSKLNLDRNFCDSFADSRYPTYLCKNPLMCAPDETSKVISSIAENSAAYRNCMHGKGYNREAN
jgi:hypothetical protein